MEEEEKTLATIDTLDNYYFYITNRRLRVVLKEISLKSKLKPIAIWGALGAIFAYDDYKQHQKELLGFDILFDEIEFISLNKSRKGGQINIKSKKWWKFLKVNKEQFEKAGLILSSIPQLKEKIKEN
jgi:hypothetical protein